MKKNYGFTLVELLAIVSLISILLIFAYPKIVDMSEKKEKEMADAKLTLIYNAMDNYINSDLNEYPRTLGTEYCLSLDELDRKNIIGVDIDDVKEYYLEKFKEDLNINTKTESVKLYVKAKIGMNYNNSYNIIGFKNDVDKMCQPVVSN